MDNFSKIDFEFLNQLYFADDEKKNEFIKYLENSLQELNITTATNRSDTITRLANSEKNFPFIAELIIFDNDYSKGKSKLESYYTALKLCKYNLQNKIANNNYDFEFEEDLLDKTLNSDLYNYARIDTLFYFGYSNNKIKNYSKRDFYFNLIRNNKFDLASSTISSFYKIIGEIYLQENDKLKALDWFKAGLLIDPKLSVKKIIQKMEREKNDS